jgi:hypothetical protein
MPGRRIAWSSILFVYLAGTLPAAEVDPEVGFAEQTLKGAGVATDGPGLLAFFKTRTVSPEDQDRLARAVRLLGDEAFEVREKASKDLTAAGRPAVAFLKAALDDPDLEIARRAERCLEAIQLHSTTGLVTAAARLLAERKPAGAVGVLLAYLPFAEDEVVEDALFSALLQAGLRDGKVDPALSPAVADRYPLRRAAAAHVLGRAPRGEDRQTVLRLLHDGDARVRFEAAAALVRSGERGSLPVLVALLQDAPLGVAWQSEELLARLAGERMPAVSLGAGHDIDRPAVRDAWDTWWRRYGDNVDLTQLKNEPPLLGLTLVCEYDGSGGGRIIELGKDGKVRWQIAGLQGANDVQALPGGRVLVAERNAGQVTERDRKGNILWKQPAPGSPISCQRLASGNTLIATFSELFEVTPDGRKVHTHTHPSGFRHALKLRDGHILYVASNGQIVELDGNWKQLRSITPTAHASGAGYWASIEPLPGARYLLTLGGANRVVEIDTSGKILWECSLPHAVFATRLRNGNTLVACFEGRALVEVDRAGREVGKLTLEGRPFTIRRY